MRTRTWPGPGSGVGRSARVSASIPKGSWMVYAVTAAPLVARGPTRVAVVIVRFTVRVGEAACAGSHAACAASISGPARRRSSSSGRSRGRARPTRGSRRDVRPAGELRDEVPQRHLPREGPAGQVLAPRGARLRDVLVPQELLAPDGAHEE